MADHATLISPPSIADFIERARGADKAPCVETGDFAFNRDLEGVMRANAKRDAAVLIGVTDHLDEPHVLLTQRTDKMRTHAGQISFPGGSIDPGDVSPQAAALRECEEETGIAPRHVQVIGQLPLYLSGSGFRIHPVLAVIGGAFEAQANRDEVDEIFYVPLSFLMTPANHQKANREWHGVQRYFYAMPFGERHIWGVTAGIIRVMYERLYRDI